VGAQDEPAPPALHAVRLQGDEGRGETEREERQMTNGVTLDQIRVAKCFADIQMVLKKHQCVLVPRLTIVGNAIQKSEFMVVAIPAEPTQ
jgi:hypothetical protein